MPWVIRDSSVTAAPGFDPAWLPPAAVRHVTARVEFGKPAAVELEAGPYVGILPLANGDTLTIAPRAGEASLSRMLAVSENLDDAILHDLNDIVSLGVEDADESHSWTELVGRAFIRQLADIERLSPRRANVKRHQRSDVARGRLLVVPTATSIARRETAPVHSLRAVRTLDNEENRVLAAAANLLLGTNHGSGDDVRRLRRWQRLGAPKSTPRDLDVVTRRLNAGKYEGSRGYYIPALVMARLLLLQGGIALDSTRQVDSQPLLTNINDLFERYLRTFLRRSLADDGYAVAKLQADVPTLFMDGTVETKPDVLVSGRSGVLLVLDAKYKPGKELPASDYYQMMAYLRVFGVAEGIIIRADDRSRLPVMRSHPARTGETVHEFQFDLSGGADAEAALLDAVSGVLGAVARRR